MKGTMAILATALIFFMLLGIFMALDRTVGHWYVPEAASTLRQEERTPECDAAWAEYEGIKGLSPEVAETNWPVREKYMDVRQRALEIVVQACVGR